ncbi:MAG: hypothetical protein CMJ58_21185 [Planctomycetaceae bacterium]|nr:hypothetical protein [Planctomycetaceae bacterium]
MPCYLFSWHGYGRWGGEPARPTAAGGQLLLPDRVIADRYREHAADPQACFDDATQRALLAELQRGAERAGLRLHAASTDAASVQAVVSWPDARPESRVRRELHDALSAQLDSGGERVWLSHRGRRQRIGDAAQFQHVTLATLRRAAGWRWDQRRGLQR